MILLALFGPGLGTPWAQESTVEQLKDLQELREEVTRRRMELRRELRLLRQVLGEGVGDTVSEYEMSVGGMTGEELAAEVRMVREELARLRERVVREELGHEDQRLRVTGEVRTRFEWNDQDFASGEADLVQLMRSRVRVVGRPQVDTRVVVEFQDARIWGEEDAGTRDASAAAIDLHQTYVEIEEVFSTPVSLRLGRQELDYGDGRLLSRAPWDIRGQAFDAVRIRYGDRSWMDVTYGKLKERGVRDRNVYGLFGHVDADQHRVEPYALMEHEKNPGEGRIRRLSVGLRANGEVPSTTGHVFGYDAQGVLQLGQIGQRDILAWMGAGTVRYRGPGWTRPQLELGVDWLSGDDDPGNNDALSFRAPYGRRHQFYGLMDLFVGRPEETADGGLVDFHLKGGMSASEDVRVRLHIHHFILAEGEDKNLGQEADVIVNYQFNPACEVSWGGMVFVPSDAVKLTRGEDPAFKTYLQVGARF